jgi:predicted dehydrogenase
MVQFGIHGGYSWDQAQRVLELRHVDAVYIPLPNSVHAEWTVRALQAGKHVLCEKPLALTLAEADLVASASVANNCVLMENFSYHYAPAYRSLEQLRGDLRAISISHSFQATQEHRLRYSLSLGGGSFLDLGCYGVDFAHRLLDSEITIDGVTARPPEQERRAWGLIDDSCTLAGRTSSGVGIWIKSSFSEPANQNATLSFSDPSHAEGRTWFIHRLFRADSGDPAEIHSLDAGSMPPAAFEPFDTEVALLNAFAEKAAAPTTDPADILRWRRNASVLEQVQSRIAQQLGIHSR